MEKIVEIVENDKIAAYDLVKEYFGDKKVCMFDIETTGLSPVYSFTYIIGLNIYEAGQWKIVQLFNDDGTSEPELIRTFHSMIEDYDILMEFNGDRFDIPYIEKRMDAISSKFGITLTNNFSKIDNFDLMKVVKPYKFALGLPNIKQKTVEKFLKIDRVDQYNGGQLIDVYLSYLSSKQRRARELVLRHNRDDMEGMIFLSHILYLLLLEDGKFSVSNLRMEDRKGLKLIFDIKAAKEPIMPLFASREGVELSCNRGVCTLSIPVTIGSFNYYYDPKGKSGCEEMSGYFATTLGEEIQGLAICRSDPKSKNRYVILNDNMLSDEGAMIRYASTLIKQILRYKGK